ncbi:hypothetical protein DES53_103409 [Roseimicrobium gellanilyticum]|uniref:Uncharacterized protein n=1 Tax=Roseimicrobium gellanilyticum TaxID=748857 RepID=A0A366HPH3_9BACT|nr:hypothetical protein [Roseimicrobium gellanilyticum]RBP45410.1 hypothetical protein DES53_103409 [Roseimicrobium gellanilyticum]
MKRKFTVAVTILLSVASSSCDHPESPKGLNQNEQPGGPVTTKPIPPPLVADEIAAEEITMPAESLMTIITAGNADEAGRAMRELARRRTDESCKLLIQVLREQASHLPSQLPSLEEAKRFEKEFIATRKYPTVDHWSQRFRKAAYAAEWLVLLDMPEANQAAKKFREEFAAKCKDSELGKILLNTVETEYHQALESVKMGAVPWKRPEKSGNP